MDSQKATTNEPTSGKNTTNRRNGMKPSAISTMRSAAQINGETKGQFPNTQFSGLRPSFVNQTPFLPPWQWFSPPYFPHQTQHQGVRPFVSINQLPTLAKSPTSKTYDQIQFGENRFPMPTHNPTPNTFYSNQCPIIPKPSASMTPDMFPQPQFGTFPTNLETTSTSRLNDSSTFPITNFLAPEVICQRRDTLHQGVNTTGSRTGFHPYQKPQQTSEASELFTPHNNYKPPRNEDVNLIDSFDNTTIFSNLGGLVNDPELQIKLQENEQKAVKIENGQTLKMQEKPASWTEEKFDLSCVICQDNKKDTVLLPCRHLCACEKCSQKFYECPLCRNKVHEYLTVFI